MAKLNRHEHFISAIETKLDTITNLTILNTFDLDKWASYEFPYCYTELGPDVLSYNYEDFNDIQGVQDFTVWIGVESDGDHEYHNSDGDLRSVTAKLNYEIEKAFKRFGISNLTNSDFSLTVDKARITGIHPVSNFGSTKYIFIVTGEIIYSQTWL